MIVIIVIIIDLCVHVKIIVIVVFVINLIIVNMFLIFTIALQAKANILQTFSTFLRLPPFWVGSIIWAG